MRQVTEDQPKTRLEHDALGPLDVPFDALYGVQTARALRNFPISGVAIGQYPDLIHALALIKKAAAQANLELGRLAPLRADLICKVCDEILAGQHLQHFPVDVFQGGAGTSTNMNMNEVIANRGLQVMGRACGDYAHLHPNDDVNRSQSTNDVYPTAVRMALMMAVPRLMARLTDLAAAFDAKGAQFAGVMKLGRTELQDAVPMTLGAEMRAYGVTLREDVERLRATVGLLAEVNLGGTAIGTGVAAPEGYRALAMANLVRLSGLPLTPASDLVEASWDAGVFVHVSGVLKRAATKLSKIANDLRLLSSGPRGGLGEIRLPAMQPGSSLMPGKVNPVIAEMVNQVAFHVIGTDVTISFAAEGGQLQLNPFEPVMAACLLQSVSLMCNAAETFRLRCVEGIEADIDRCRRNLEASTANFAELVPVIGYERASSLAKAMLADGESWTDVAPRLAELSVK
jgi:aspartate ammonia-lyase